MFPFSVSDSQTLHIRKTLPKKEIQDEKSIISNVLEIRWCHEDVIWIHGNRNHEKSTTKKIKE